MILVYKHYIVVNLLSSLMETLSYNLLEVAEFLSHIHCRSGGVQFSFQNAGKTQGSMKCETLHGPSSHDANEGKDLEIPETGMEGLSPQDLNSPDARDGSSLWQLILEEELNENSSVTPKTPAHSSEVHYWTL